MPPPDDERHEVAIGRAVIVLEEAELDDGALLVADQLRRRDGQRVRARLLAEVHMGTAPP
jgi:hypothetical protein